MEPIKKSAGYWIGVGSLLDWYRERVGPYWLTIGSVSARYWLLSGRNPCRPIGSRLKNIGSRLARYWIWVGKGLDASTRYWIRIWWGLDVIGNRLDDI